jgi:nucleotide-binding universal stress UspA family protein
VTEILTEAEEWGADLIALGVGVRRRFRRLGGVAEQILRRAEPPVALLRGDRRETGAGAATARRTS